MNKLIPTTMIALGVLVASAPRAKAQGTSTTIPGASAFDLSSDGGFVTGFGANGTFVWNPVTGFTYLQGGVGSVQKVSAYGFTVAGQIDDLALGNKAAGYWSLPTDTWTSLGQHPNQNGGCPTFGTAYAVSDDGMTLGGLLWDGCKTDAFMWTAATGFTLMADANDSARLNDMSGDGTMGGGWIQTTSRVAAMWDTAGNLTQPLVSPANPSGFGEIFGVNWNGDSFTGSANGGAFLMRKGVFTDINAALGTPQSVGNGISHDGRVVVGWSGTGGPFGVQTGMVYTDWLGAIDATAFFAMFGVPPPVGQTSFSDVRSVSGDANSFLAIAGGFPLTESVLITLPDSFNDLGGGTLGTLGIPTLEGYGWLNPGMSAGLSLENAATGSVAVLTYGGTYTPTPLFGGIVGPLPADGFLFFPTGAAGEVDFTFTWPVTMPSGVQLYVQYGILDASATGGISLSNTVRMIGN